jgi:hypothetical protein
VSLAILKKQDFKDFVNRLLPLYRIGGPVQKNGGFAFETIQDPEELRLDYPTPSCRPKSSSSR